MRKSILTAALCLSMGGLCSAGDADAAIRRETNIPAQGLGPALNAFAKDRSLQVVYQSKVVGHLRTQGATGNLSTEEELKQLLIGTGLTYRYVDEKTVTLIAEDQVSTGVAPPPADPAQSDFAGKSMRLTQSAPSSDSGNVSSNSPIAASALGEIVVTAQKRAERLQDVPMPMSVLNGNALAESEQTRIQDYFATVPGLSFQKAGYGSILAIRGLVTGGAANPTVGILIDDVPYGATVNPGSASYSPDLDPGDLARIEVLRGPQGVLYGASSLGGLIKYVTIDPSVDGISGRVEVGTDGVRNGSGLGYNVRGSVNVPLSSTWAIRASAFKREDPGYVDNIGGGQRAANSTAAQGGRLASLWRPSDIFSLKLSALVQDVRIHGADYVDSSLGTGLENNILRGTGLYNRKSEAYNATMNLKLGKVDIVSITGYSADRDYDFLDGGPFFNGLAENGGGPGSEFAGYGVTGSSYAVPQNTNKFTEELRASLPIGEHVDLMVGGFYTREQYEQQYILYANERPSGATVATMLTIDSPNTYKEYAGFANATFKITDRFNVQVGARESENKQAFSSTRFGPVAFYFYGANPSFVPEVHSKDNSFTYLVTPSFKISPDLMVYARMASGYRPGGANANCTGAIPCHYSADTTQNYDVGIKGSVLDRTLSFDASLYYIQWKDVQISITDPATQLVYQANAGRAKSEGVELSAEASPLEGLTLSGWIAYNISELTKDFPPLCSPQVTMACSGVVGLSGDRLPYSSRFTGSLSVLQEYPLWTHSKAFVGGTVSYVGNRLGQFGSTPDRVEFPAYAQVDLRAGLNVQSWKYTAYCNNAADRRGVINSGALELGDANLVNYIQPRTIGITVSRSF